MEDGGENFNIVLKDLLLPIMRCLIPAPIWWRNTQAEKLNRKLMIYSKYEALNKTDELVVRLCTWLDDNDQWGTQDPPISEEFYENVYWQILEEEAIILVCEEALRNQITSGRSNTQPRTDGFTFIPRLTLLQVDILCYWLTSNVYYRCIDLARSKWPYLLPYSEILPKDIKDNNLNVFFDCLIEIDNNDLCELYNNYFEPQPAKHRKDKIHHAKKEIENVKIMLMDRVVTEIPEIIIRALPGPDEDDSEKGNQLAEFNLALAHFRSYVKHISNRHES